MNSKQAKRLRKAALGFAVVMEETGRKMSETQVKALYKRMKKGDVGADNLQSKERAPGTSV